MSHPWFFHHLSEDPFIYPVTLNLLKVRLFVPAGLDLACSVVSSDRYEPPGRERPVTMERVGSAGAYEIYEAVIEAPMRRSRYLFYAENPGGMYAWYGERGISENRERAGSFQIPYIHRPRAFEFPSWTKGSIVYQIFPSSFHPDGLKGITERLYYLRELGVNLVYMTPIFDSPSAHKYDTTDYYMIDENFGSMEDLKELVQVAHRNGIRVILDAVFNHSGDKFFAFQDVMEKGEASSYTKWFHIDSFPVVQSPVPNYETFGTHLAYMPKLNLDHPAAAEYMIDVAKYWVKEAGIDGWRFDVSNEVSPSFWRRVRDELKALNPELLLIGEVMHASGQWLRGDMFDGAMNYLLRDAMLSFFAEQTVGPRGFMEQLLHLEALYNDQANLAMFQLIGSHDTERFLTACGRGRGWDKEATAKARLKLAVFFQMTYLGIPMIYYGDEVGMEGKTDPDCRRPMIWESKEQSSEMLEWYRTLISSRKSRKALTEGTYRNWFMDEPRNLLGYTRRSGRDVVGMVINNSPNRYELELPAFRQDKANLIEVLSGEAVIGGGAIRITIEPFGCLMLE
ncbi:glycoside hydrolase family 13 protein [Paenibacillus sp. sgz500958]|uniref:glycoside hydrolase family 13 protein n=1 Tax=Paenibacillus sp. sgz500958 TaxID=3242475 RepID=UPI0036D209E6